MSGAQSPQGLDAIHAGHLHIKEDERNLLLILVQFFQPFISILRDDDFMTFASKEVAQRFAYSSFIINDQHQMLGRQLGWFALVIILDWLFRKGKEQSKAALREKVY